MQLRITHYALRIKQLLSDKGVVLLLAFLVGLFASVAGWVLHLLIHEIQHLLRSGFRIESFNWLYLVLPVVGIWLTSLFVKYVVKDNISHGITRVLCHRLCHHHRLRWFGRCRGTYSSHR